MDDTDTEDTPRQMIDVDNVLRLVPVCLRTLKRMEARGTFPAGRMVAGRKFWFADEVARWQRNLDTRLGRTHGDRAKVA